MQLAARSNRDTLVRRFATMILTHYSFPVLIGVVDPTSIRMLGHFNLNPFLQRMIRKKQVRWWQYIRTLLWLAYSPQNAESWAQRRRHIMDLGTDMDGMENEYIRFLWRTAHRHGKWQHLRPPIPIQQGQSGRTSQLKHTR